MMRRFQLFRKTDVTGLSGTGIVLEGALMSSGQIVVQWFGDAPSTTIHPSFEKFAKIHVHGHPDDNEIVWLDPSVDIIQLESSEPFERGRSNALQDSYENAPFGSVGGLEN